MVYLVTGGGGFIGSHIVRALVQDGKQVRVLDNSSSGSRSRLSDIQSDVDWQDGDIRDVAAVKKACQDVEVVFHHAAVASVPQSVAHPEMTHEVNVTGTLNILRIAQVSGVRRVLFASSSAVYGDLPTTPKHEMLPTRPISPYGVQKLAAEAYCRVWHKVYGLETVSFRYFNVFGPHQDPQSDYAAVIPRFITAVLAGNAPIIYGDGEQSRDFIPVQDVVAINLLAAHQPSVIGQVFNVGRGTSLTLNQLITELSAITNTTISPRYEAGRSGDIRESLADVALLHSLLDFHPPQSLRERLNETFIAYSPSSKG